MAKENDKNEKGREDIQQKPDQVDDQDQKPATPEPPQRKYPLEKPRSDKSDKE